jgi:DNA modification methylase
MNTHHSIEYTDARKLQKIENNSIDLVVTSPPYPMIEMWDDTFTHQNPEIKKAFNNNDGLHAFELMHRELDKAWKELYRVVKPGGMVCINIGDATRTINSKFRLYNNHSRILQSFLDSGFNNLPNILWRKQTNAPNKFMGSGMLPPGAYVTLEHEYILIFRKGNKRTFNKKEDKARRQQSAYFWEERNIWFSDLWDLKGTKQQILNGKTRERSGAFPFELAYRLINMFSLRDDKVLDPFLGTGTTTFAAIASQRNSIGIEIDKSFSELITTPLNSLKKIINTRIEKRLNDHLKFVDNRKEKGKELKHSSEYYGFPVMTKQEKNILIHFVDEIKFDSAKIEATYIDEPMLSKPSK